MTGMTWIGELCRWMADWVPQWVQVDRNELAIKHRGWRTRKALILKPGVRWYWPAFSQTEGPFKTVWQPLTTSTINVMDANESPVSARGFAVWRIVDVLKFGVDHDDATSMLDDLVCAAIREVLTAKSISDIQKNDRNTTDKALLREVKELTAALGVEIQLVRLTTFTSTKVFSHLGDNAPVTVDDTEDEES